MDFNIDVRKNQLESINQFILTSRNSLKSIYLALGWSEDLSKEETLTTICPYNAGHDVPAAKLDDHVKRCYFKHLGYNDENKFLSEPIDHGERSIKLDVVEKIKILTEAHLKTPYFKAGWNGQDPDPLTSDRLISTFSTDERLALYDYCIENTKGPGVPPEFDTSTTSKKEKDSSYSNEELKSFARDIKRRSVKYKSVHTSNKNYKEIIGEVIGVQMKEYTDWLDRSKRIKTDRSKSETVERPCSSVSRASTNSDVSSKTRSPGRGSKRTDTESDDRRKDRRERRRLRSRSPVRRRRSVHRSRGRNRRSRSRDRKSKSR